MPPSASRLIARLGLNHPEPGNALLRPVAGGDMATAWCLTDGDHAVFVKGMHAGDAAVLRAERDGLAALAETKALRVPRVLGFHEDSDSAWLALEWLEIRRLNTGTAAGLGEGLAAMHQHSDTAYGFHADNFLGRTPQPNDRTSDWSAFFLEHRIRHQLQRLHAADPGGGWSARFDPLARSWRHLCGEHRPPVSLIHGDLWSGNAGRIGDEPVVFDPAVHYADRECDLAMADLFGGFPDDFFAAYLEAWPLPAGWRQRRRFYQLYHLLNHANLFGGHYRSICRKLIDDLCRRET